MNLSTLDTVRQANRSRVPPTVASVTSVLVLVTLSVLFAVQLVQSLQWRMAHDAAVVQFLAYAQNEFGLTLYRDLVDTVLPVSVLIQGAVGRLFGYGDAAFRGLDVFWLLALLGVSWAILRPLGRLVAWAGPLLFGLIYLGHGPAISFQRDYTGLLPIAISLWIAGRSVTTGRGLAGRMIMIGVLFGLAMGIKPQLVLGLPIVFLLAMASATPAGDSLRSITWRTMVIQGAVLALALGVTLAAVIGWVVMQGAGPDLIIHLTRILPFYNEMTGQFKILAPTDRLIYLFTSWQMLGGQAILLAGALLGGYVALFVLALGSAHKRLVMTLLVLTAVYALYPVPAGKFWTYHWLPYFYFGSLGTALVLMPLEQPLKRPARQLVAIGLWAVVAVLAVRPAPDFYRQLKGELPRAPRDGRVDEMAGFLRENLRPGETVQPLDFVTGGVLHAMLIAGAPPATPYIHISLLNHHISSPLIQSQRADLLSRLESERPRFMIDIPERARPTGPDTDLVIPELATFLDAEYDVALTGNGYVIYELTK